MCGIICDKTCARLLKESELTLQAALNICRANKATSSQLKSLSTNTMYLPSKKKPSDKPKPKCDKCGNKNYGHQPCPAQGVECYNCGRKNHITNLF